MNRTTKLTLAAALPVAALATAVQSASASPPPIEPPNPDSSVVVPADFVILTDDTGTITIGIPNSWTDVYTSPLADGPSIQAAPDFEAAVYTFDVPGVDYRAVSFTADTQELAHAFKASGCATEELQPYDDGVFVGSHRIYTGCGDQGTAEFHVVAANPDNQAFTALLQIQITGPDEAPILDGILATFNTTGGFATPSVPGGRGGNGGVNGGDSLIVTAPTRGGNGGVFNVDAAPVTAPTRGGTGGVFNIGAAPVTARTTTVVPPTTTAATAAAFPPPTGDVPSDWAMLFDDTGTLAIRVPSTWTAIDLAPKMNGDGSQQPWISATTDHGLFFPPEGTADTFSVPGVIFRTYPMEPVTTDVLEASVYNDVCTADPVQTYDDGVYAGYIRSFNGCGGTDSRIIELVATGKPTLTDVLDPQFGSVTVGLLVQLTGQPDDAATLNGLLSSFVEFTGFDGLASVLSDLTTTVAVPAPTTTVAVPAPTTSVVGAPTTAAAGNNPLGVLEQQLHDQLGLAITNEQAICLANVAGQLDPNEIEAAANDLYGMPAAVLVALLNCGVNIFDVPSG